MDIEIPINELILKTLKNQHPIFSLPTSNPDPYLNCGCHPDIVSRLWNEINSNLPTDCRGMIYFKPALVDPNTGIIFGLAIGTQYALFLPEELSLLAKQAGLETIYTWSDKTTTNLEQTCGKSWFFGKYLKEEIEWCKKVYTLLSTLHISS